MTPIPTFYRPRADHGLEAAHPDGDPPVIGFAPDSEIAILYQRDAHDPDRGQVEAHGARDVVEAAWRGMWPALMRNPDADGGRLAARLVLEVFPVAALNVAMITAINATLCGQASPVTLRARLTALGLQEG